MSTPPPRLHLGIFATHPIQYHLPWFRILSGDPRVELTVLFKMIPDSEVQGRGFETDFEWDIPTLEGYQWKVLRNQKGIVLGKKQTGPSMLYTSLFELDAALVTGWNDSFLLAAAAAARITGKPLVVRAESNALRPRSECKDFLHEKFLCLFDKYLAIGEANQSFYTNHGVDRSDVFRSGYFVDNERFNRQYRELEPRRKTLRAEWDIAPGEVCILFVGKFVDKKRPLDLLRAFERLAGPGNDCHLLMVGDGPKLKTCRAAASERKLPVTFTGFLNQTEIARAYMAGDALVLPSDYGETWGLVVNEAMIFENPAIVSDRVGCGPDLVHDDETGYVFPFGDIQALARRIKDMVENDEKRRSMGRNARRLILEKYNPKDHSETTIEAVRAAWVEKHPRWEI